MKKLHLKAIELGTPECLTREQMKSILGGNSIGGGTPSCDSPSCLPTQRLCIVVDSSCSSGYGSYCSAICPAF